MQKAIEDQSPSTAAAVVAVDKQPLADDDDLDMDDLFGSDSQPLEDKAQPPFMHQDGGSLWLMAPGLKLKLCLPASKKFRVIEASPDKYLLVGSGVSSRTVQQVLKHKLAQTMTEDDLLVNPNARSDSPEEAKCGGNSKAASSEAETQPADAVDVAKAVDAAAEDFGVAGGVVWCAYVLPAVCVWGE